MKIESLPKEFTRVDENKSGTLCHTCSKLPEGILSNIHLQQNLKHSQTYRWDVLFCKSQWKDWILGQGLCRKVKQAGDCPLSYRLSKYFVLNYILYLFPLKVECLSWADIRIFLMFLPLCLFLMFPRPNLEHQIRENARNSVLP